MRARAEKRLNRLAKMVLRNLKKSGKSVEILLLSERELGRLKARFGLKNKGKKPDVFAFPEPPGFPHPENRMRKSLGEIYLNRELGVKRLKPLLIHGILHLAGYAHEKKNDILRMEAIEERLIREVSNPKH